MKTFVDDFLFLEKQNIDFIICSAPVILAQLQREILITVLALLPVSDASSFFLLLYIIIFSLMKNILHR